MSHYGVNWVCPEMSLALCMFLDIHCATLTLCWLELAVLFARGGEGWSTLIKFAFLDFGLLLVIKTYKDP